MAKQKTTLVNSVVFLHLNGDGGSRTLVQKHRHLSIYECSQYISNSLTVPPIDWHPGS